MTVREIVYLILDELKLVSDDSHFTEEHIMFMINKNRMALLMNKYDPLVKPRNFNATLRNVLTDNYQVIKIPLSESSIKLPGGFVNYISNSEIPVISHMGHTVVFNNTYYHDDFAFVSKDRMKYVGYHKYNAKTVYCSIDENFHLRVKATETLINDLVSNDIPALEFAYMNAVFDDVYKAHDMSEDDSDYLDMEFPLEFNLVQELINTVVQELLGVMYVPMDTLNNAKDDSQNIQQPAKSVASNE